MNYIILIIVALAGIALGMYITRRNGNGLIVEQTAKKAENKQKILTFVTASSAEVSSTLRSSCQSE